MRSKVFVIEGHPLMRRSLVEAIERDADLTVCGCTESAQDALAAILTFQPDIVLIDIQLKSPSGLDLIKALQMHSRSLRIIATSLFDVKRNERLARAAGAAAFVAKQDGPDKLLDTILSLLRTNVRQNGGGQSDSGLKCHFGK